VNRDRHRAGLERAGSILQDRFAEFHVSKRRLRQAESIKLVRDRRNAANQQLGFASPLASRTTCRATEQAKIEFVAPGYVRNIVVIISELGLRYKKELLPMKKEQIDLENGLVHIADSKTVNGIGDMPLTPAAHEALQRQMKESVGSEYLFPSPKIKAQKPYMTNLRKVWAAT
jgi:integrase